MSLEWVAQSSHVYAVERMDYREPNTWSEAWSGAGTQGVMQVLIEPGNYRVRTWRQGHEMDGD